MSLMQLSWDMHNGSMGISIVLKLKWVDADICG
jgi:hypothetical protein